MGCKLWLIGTGFLFAVPACTHTPPASPEAPDSVALEQSVQAADGETIYFETHGEGEFAVVFVHCWGCSRQFWQHQVEPVSMAGYRVVTLDLPGHGQASTSRQDWRVAEFGADVEAVIEELDLERVILVGHSMGGPVSLATAARLPGRVVGVGCVDTLHNAEVEFPAEFAETFAARLETDFAAGIEEFLDMILRPGTDPELAEWISRQALDASPEALAGLMRDFAALDMPLLFEQAGVPIRCINAQPEDGRGMATAIEINRKYADFDAVLMDGVGHYPQLESPEAFNRHLIEVLAKLADVSTIQ